MLKVKLIEDVKSIPFHEAGILEANITISPTSLRICLSENFKGNFFSLTYCQILASSISKSFSERKSYAEHVCFITTDIKMALNEGRIDGLDAASPVESVESTVLIIIALLQFTKNS